MSTGQRELLYIHQLAGNILREIRVHYIDKKIRLVHVAIGIMQVDFEALIEQNGLRNTRD